MGIVSYTTELRQNGEDFPRAWQGALLHGRPRKVLEIARFDKIGRKLWAMEKLNADYSYPQLTAGNGCQARSTDFVPKLRKSTIGGGLMFAAHTT